MSYEWTKELEEVEVHKIEGAYGFGNIRGVYVRPKTGQQYWRSSGFRWHRNQGGHHNGCPHKLTPEQSAKLVVCIQLLERDAGAWVVEYGFQTLEDVAAEVLGLIDARELFL